MNHRSTSTTSTLSRRGALAGLSAGGLGVALASRGALAQEATPNSLSGHPQVGVWMVESPIGRAIAVYSVDGSVVTALAATQAGPQGVAYSSTQIGTWEATGERGAHLTVVQLLSDQAGAYSGSVTVDSFQEVSEDGQTWISGAGASVTIRDAADTVVNVITDGPPANGTRMAPGRPGLPEGPAAAATPTS